MKITDEGALLLSMAIVRQAGKDYMNSYRYKTGECHLYGREELEKFFTSDWYEQLTDIDSGYIMNEIKKEAKRRGLKV